VSPEGEACNHCPSCFSFNEGSSLNIHELDAASNNSVDDIRALVEQVRFAPQPGKHKVYIIDEVHMLSSSAFNAFLKTLEEPPPYAIFILATTEKHKILPTILSRCQIFDFKRISIEDTVAHLQEICDKEEIHAELAALQLIAQKSEGCMRDALSILDKIVSFTNGEVSYALTLEHLNILDADNYFKLMEAMQHQDLAQALLLYDDINRKGFEGDLVLNGFAEFIRNLLVCKDEKVASLLEVVGNFRDKYISVGRAADSAYLISALNLLGEAEINYRSARNKRLHVELALIKLCYLGQALSRGAEDIEGNQKIAGRSRPVSFRNIPVMEWVGPKAAASGSENLAAAKGPGSPPLRGGGAKLIVETPREKEATAALPSLGSLSKIRQQFSTRQPHAEDNTGALDPEALQKAWIAYTRQLKDAKSPAAPCFENAVLNITARDAFEIVCSNNLEQKFIEQEKRNLSDSLQKTFAIRTLSFTINVHENNDAGEPAERPLNKREQFLRITEQYPLVKELKDRLRLELDY
jgi:DNA polymerase III subunit gamma/tau